MPTAPSARLALTAPVGGDPNDYPADMVALIAELEARAGGWLPTVATYVGLPVAGAGNDRFLVYVTDSRALFRSDGAAWSPVPTIASMTTVQRDALAAGGQWDGRVIYNTTTLQLEQYAAGSATWGSLVAAHFSRFLNMGA